MSTRIRSRQTILQWTALLAALITFWMSGIATLRHTDDLTAFLTFRAGHTSLRHTAAPPAQSPCAACEWEQALAAPHTPAIHIITLPFVQARYATVLPRTIHILPFDYTDLRGPPFTAIALS